MVKRLADFRPLKFYASEDKIIGCRPIYSCMVALHAPYWVIAAKAEYVKKYYNFGRDPFIDASRVQYSLLPECKSQTYGSYFY